MVEFIPAGRLGNYFFELATIVSYALKHNLDFTAPFNTSNEFWSPIYLKHLQNTEYNPHLDRVDIWENGHEFQEIPFDESWRDKNIMIHGYRQSEKYFIEHRKELLYLFDLRWKLKPNIASIHIRRTDYLLYPDKHIPFSMEYINNAMNYLINNNGVESFEVYSDDTISLMFGDLIYNAGNTYSIPIFLANLHLESSIHQNHLDSYHKMSYYCIEFFWKNLSKNFTIKYLMNYDAELLHYWQVLRVGSNEKNNQVISELEKIYHIDFFYKMYLVKQENNK